MIRLGVTLLAQPGQRDPQQASVNGAVRLMAVHAVFTHRRVLEQEGSALFRMALVAVLVDTARLQQFLRHRPVRIVAVRALYLAFPLGHMRGAVKLRTTVLVALETGLVLGRFD